MTRNGRTRRSERSGEIYDSGGKVSGGELGAGRAEGGEAFPGTGETGGRRGAPDLSRRRFAQLFGAAVAAAGGTGLAAATPARAADWAPAALRTWLREPRGAALKGAPGGAARSAGTVVRLSANENPYGPSPAAFDAMREAFGAACRYPDEEVTALTEDVARLHGVDAAQVLLGAGSSEILNLAAVAFTGPGRPAVAAEPSFESLPRHARRHGAETVAVPLTADFRHDLPKMLAAAPDPGLLYVCNPNNPTATITPKSELRALLAKAPERTLVLVDEAYFHFVDSEDYETVIPLVAAHPNLVVTRTFSKIYGMAGLRCGYAVAQPAVISRLRQHQAFDSVNILALAAARASLRDGDQVSRGRRLNREVRTAVCAELDRRGFTFIPSTANFMMIDLRRPVGPVIRELRQHNVEVGREFPALPHHLRVTIGTADDMQAFLAAFGQVAAGRG